MKRALLVLMKREALAVVEGRMLEAELEEKIPVGKTAGGGSAGGGGGRRWMWKWRATE